VLKRLLLCASDLWLLKQLERHDFLTFSAADSNTASLNRYG
jgi:hypothetical protein